MEEWRDISGYEGLYQVSSCGRVKSLRNNQGNYREKILKQKTDKRGYKHTCLWKNGKTKYYLVHRLVALTFIENLNNYPEVNHKDECKYNNYVENLEWCTVAYNNSYGTRLGKISKALTGENHPMYGKTGANASRSRKVQCINTDRIFDTITEAANWSETHAGNIIAQIKGKQKTSGKHPITGERLTWRYYEE